MGVHHQKSPWLLGADRLRAVEVLFCANVQVLGGDADQKTADEAVTREVRTRLNQNQAVTRALAHHDSVSARFHSTAGLAIDLVKLVCHRIHRDGYNRQFGTPVKDVIRELHRFLWPTFHRASYGAGKQKLVPGGLSFEENVQKETALALLGGFGVTEEKLRRWLSTAT